MKPGDLSLHLEAYLAWKKALGFPLGARERLLRDFVAFAESSGVRGTINAQVAFDWACSVSDRCGISGRSLAWPRKHRDDAHLRRGRSCDEGTGTGTDCACNFLGPPIQGR